MRRTRTRIYPPRAFSRRPFNRAALANIRGQFPRNDFQSRLAENFHRAVVYFQRIVKGNFIVREAKIAAALLAFRICLASSINAGAATVFEP